MAALVIETRLATFLAANAARQWQWGVVDCCMAPADWSMALGYPDPVPDLRGAYHDEESCRLVVTEGGGLVRLASRLENVGWKRAHRPVEGAIAIIGHGVDGQKQWAAIRHKDRWQVRMDVGFVAFTARPLAVWVP